MKLAVRFFIGVIALIVIAACEAPNPLTAQGTMTSTPTISAPATGTRPPGPPSATAVAIAVTLRPTVVNNPTGTAMPIAGSPQPTTIPLTHQLTSIPLTPLPNCPPLPTPTVLETQAAVQHFEHGLMLWLQTKNEIWVLVDSPVGGQSGWRILPNLFYEGMAESDPTVLPPPPRYQPVRGFGYAWRIGGGAYGPQRVELGWAVDKEVGLRATLTYYPQGSYSPDCTWLPRSGIYKMRDIYNNIYRFSEEGATARIVTPTP